LGALIGKKNAAVVALPEPRKEDKAELTTLVGIAQERYNNENEHRRQWGGGKLGPKARARIARQKRIIAREEKLRQKAAAR